MPALAPRARLRDIGGMAARPCKPGADMKGLWRLLLPDTPFPACGAPESTDAEGTRDNPDAGLETQDPSHVGGCFAQERQKR